MEIVTNRQIKLCKIIRKEKYLYRILLKGHISDYIELQETFAPGSLVFSDFDMDEKTMVSLGDSLTEELEHIAQTLFRERFTWFLSICAIIISIIALFRP